MNDFNDKELSPDKPAEAGSWAENGKTGAIENYSLGADKTRSYHLATFKQRALAFIIDMVLISLINMLLLNGFDLSDYKQILSDNTLYLGLTGSLYFIFFTRYFTQTPGKMLLKIKVVREDGRKLDWKTVMIRELFGKIVSQLRILYLGYFYCLVSSKKQCWHDIFADTFVVQKSQRRPKEKVIFINEEQ